LTCAPGWQSGPPARRQEEAVRRLIDAGLARLQDLKNLKTLNLQNTEVTKQGVEQFLKRVPLCTVKY
jgi:hypothetical protein